MTGARRTDAATEAARAALKGARAARSNFRQAEQAVLHALVLAPADFEVRLAAYKLYFYNHRLAEALPHAEYLLASMARRLNIPGEWRHVEPGDAAFAELEAEPGLYLQALIACGYCMVRLGARDEGAEALGKAASLDPRDRFGARRLLAVLAQGDCEMDSEISS